MRELGSLCAAIAGVALLLGYCVWSRMEAYKRGYEKGYDKGHESGRNAADDWWFGVEEEVDQERVKIWREKR